MTAAFAVGQLVGPFTVSVFRSSALGAMVLASVAAAAVLLLGTLALVLGPVPGSRASRPLTHEGGAPDDRRPEGGRHSSHPREAMDEAQRAAANGYTAGPRKGVKGPFHPVDAQPAAHGAPAEGRRVPALSEARYLDG